MGDVLVVYGRVTGGDTPSIDNEVYNMQAAVRQKSEALIKKRSLGELDQAGYTKAVADLRQQTEDTVVKWAQGK